ncbi:hypothetical protein OIO90_006265 [Microbotryomycetes sp. JL221]|nr:hypothetical protein OIO90_006265 [Microbotryomycetes sp. JL221]
MFNETSTQRSSLTLNPTIKLTRSNRVFSTSTRKQEANTKPFILADIGEGITQVEIVKWNVQVGQTIQEFDPVVEVMSDKATVEITSPYSGKIVKLSGNEGDTITVGKMLLEVEVEGEGGSEGQEQSNGAQTESLTPTATQTPTANEVGQSGDATTSQSTPQSSTQRRQDESSKPDEKRQVWATPATRRLAKEHNLDLGMVPGTGPQGRVTKGDVLEYVNNGGSNKGKEATTSSTTLSATKSSSSSSSGATTTIPLSPVRKAMYRAMTSSLQIPHFSYSESIDVTALERLRLKLNKSIPLRYRKTLKPSEEQQLRRLTQEWHQQQSQTEDGLVGNEARFDRITMLPLLIKAMSLSMFEHPLFTCLLDNTASSTTTTPSSLVRRPNHDISIALSAPSGGLYTPCLPSVDNMSSFDIASQITQLQSIASSTPSGSPKFPESTKRSGTITLSNVGVVGGTTTHPIVPPTGQLAIGALGRTRVEPKYVGKSLKLAKEVAKGEVELDEDVNLDLRVEPRLIMDVTFSADHRIVEGVELAKLIETWKRFIEEPERIVGHAR